MNTENIILKTGSHVTADKGLCAMEAVAFLAGEKHSDAPQCACPVITRFVQCINDRWDDVERQRLVPLLPTLIGTRNENKAAKRAYIAADWAVREVSSAWFDFANLPESAARIRALSPVVDIATAHAARDQVNAERKLVDARAVAAAARAVDYAAYAAAAAEAAEAAEAAVDYATYANATHAYAADYASYAAYTAADAYAAYAAEAAAHSPSFNTSSAAFRLALHDATLSVIERMVNA